MYVTNPRTFETAFDKMRTLALADELGIPSPKTYDCQTLDAISSLAKGLSYPIVLKPRSTVYWSANGGVQQTPAFAFSEAELKNKIRLSLCETGEFPLVQEFVRGEEVGVEFLCHHGQPLAVCAHRRIRSASPRGGASVVNETIPDSYCGIGDLARRLVARLDWNGPAMVEFKICERTHQPQLMEINARFWGSLPLAVASGVDFPFLFYRLCLGDPLPCQGSYQLGVKTRSLVGDMLHLAHVLFDEDPLRPILYPSRKRAAIQFLKTFFQCRPTVFNARDVLPSAAQWLDVWNGYSRRDRCQMVGTPVPVSR